MKTYVCKYECSYRYVYLYIQTENEKIAQKCLHFEHWLCIKYLRYKESI